MTSNQYEHFMVLIEAEEKDGKLDLTLKPIAIDLSPDRPATMRHLEKSEFPDDIDGYVHKARLSMDSVNDRFIDQVITAFKQTPDNVKYFGYVELVEQFQNAPHLLLCNLLASVLSGCAQVAIIEDSEKTNQ